MIDISLVCQWEKRVTKESHCNKTMGMQQYNGLASATGSLFSHFDTRIILAFNFYLIELLCRKCQPYRNTRH
uniref:Uncharacterized protein n=1 Tax=Daphnia magna TaxID=35525 RepID=A0A0P6HTB4_9CRUS